ncbi:nucleotide sugar dehydrogenase, partial [bacterium]|nr:nucleotide sugar dehydrogenase [bacterium]
MKISVIGAGYVGLVSGAIFAEKGHSVLCVDSDKSKIERLLKGKSPIYEPGLDELLEKNIKAKKLKFGNTVKEAVDFGEVIFIAVGTPSRADGSADLSYVENVAREIAKDLKEYRVIVDKSTVPVETGEWVAKTIKYNNKHGVDFDVVSNPEFLREGSAIEDALNPDRIVIGAGSQKAFEVMNKVYKPWKDA